MAIIKGENFEAMIVEVNQDRLDNDKIRELLTPEQLLECTKTVTFNQIKCNRITGEKPKFKMPDLSNATPTGLVDMLGDVREQIKDLQKLEGIYKDALSARLKD
jgi:hypothetical protein